MRKAKKHEAIALERQQMAHSLGLSASDQGADGIDWLAYTLPSRQRRVVGDVLTGRVRNHLVTMFDLWTERPPDSWEPISGPTFASYEVECTVVVVTLPARVGGVLLTPRNDWRMPRHDVRHPQLTGNEWLDAVFSIEARNPLSATVLNDAGFAYAASQLPYPSSIELSEGQLVCAHWALSIGEQAAYLHAALLLAEALPEGALKRD